MSEIRFSIGEKHEEEKSVYWNRCWCFFTLQYLGFGEL